MVSGADDAGHDNGVDEGARGLGAGHLEDQGEGGDGGATCGKARGVVGQVQADEEHGEDVEEEDAPEHVLDHARDVLGGVLGLSCGDGDGFGAAVWKRGLASWSRGQGGGS